MSYIVAKALPTTKRVEVIDKKEFAKGALDEHVKASVMHVTFLSIISIYLAKEDLMALLVVKKVKVLTEYSNFSDVFLKQKASILLKITKLN